MKIHKGFHLGGFSTVKFEELWGVAAIANCCLQLFQTLQKDSLVYLYLFAFEITAEYDVELVGEV